MFLLTLTLWSCSISFNELFAYKQNFTETGSGEMFRMWRHLEQHLERHLKALSLAEKINVKVGEEEDEKHDMTPLNPAGLLLAK